MHITKTTISGDGSVRREMRFRTQSADSRVTQATQRWVGGDEIKEPMMGIVIVMMRMRWLFSLLIAWDSAQVNRAEGGLDCFILRSCN